MSASSADAAIRTLASYHHTTVTRENPSIECELPLDGSRFAGQIPPLVSSPVFAVRKRASRVFTLEQYVGAGIITPEQKEFLCEAVKNHRNVLITGSTGSGKSTLLNGIIHELTDQFPNERLVIIEDTAEIQCSAKDYVQYHTSPERSMTQLVRMSLRIAAGPNTCRRSKGAGGARSPDVLEYRTRGRDGDTARQQFRDGPDQAVHFGEHAFRCSQGH